MKPALDVAGLPPRAAIIGWALRTPLGSDVSALHRALLRGERAAAPSPIFDTSSYPGSLVAAIVTPPKPSRHRRFLRRLGLLAIESVEDALTHARSRAAFPIINSERIGLFFGYGGLRAHWDDLMLAMQNQQADADGNPTNPNIPLPATWEYGLRHLHPFWMLLHLSNNAHALCAEQLQILGEGVTYGGSNAGAQALSGAIQALAAGAVDLAVVAAHDTLVEPEVLVEQGSKGVLTSANLQTLRAPYDRAAAGFVPGEATAALILQRPAEAASTPLAYLQVTDGADGQSGAPHAHTLARVAARLGDLSDIQIVDGAARAQSELDSAERSLIAELVSNRAQLTASQSALGQLGAATPLVQCITLATQLQQQVLAGVAGLEQPAPGAMTVLKSPTATAAKAALLLSMGSPGLCGAVRLDLP